MTGIFGDVAAAWRTAAERIAVRPLPFLIAAALLTGTDLLLWKAGLMDGGRPTEASRPLLALFLVSKLLITLGWLLASIRLAADPSTPRLLALGRRQLLWIGTLLLLMPLALAARLVLQKAIGAALAPLAPDPRTVLLLGIAAYLAVFLYLQVRLLPALVAVLLGDPEAGLRWSWRGTEGRGLAFAAIILLAVLPLFALHFGISLGWLPEGEWARLTALALDGAVMAALLLVGSAAYVGFYGKVKKARGGEPDRVPAAEAA